MELKAEIEELKEKLLKLQDDKQNMLVQIQELEGRKRSLTENVFELHAKKKDLEIEIDKKIEETEAKCKAALDDAHKKSGEAQNKIADVSKFEMSLKEKERALNDLALSLENKRLALEKESEDFKNASKEIANELSEKSEHLAKNYDTKIAALADAEARNKELLESIKKSSDELYEKSVAFKALEDRIASEKKAFESLKSEVEAKSKEVMELESESKKELSVAKKLLDSCILREAAVAQKEKDFQARSYSLDLKVRELSARESKVNKLIEIHKLEEEVKCL
jgi:chromosome segregation ATPase